MLERFGYQAPPSWPSIQHADFAPSSYRCVRAQGTHRPEPRSGRLLSPSSSCPSQLHASTMSVGWQVKSSDSQAQSRRSPFTPPPNNTTSGVKAIVCASDASLACLCGPLAARGTCTRLPLLSAADNTDPERWVRRGIWARMGGREHAARPAHLECLRVRVPSASPPRTQFGRRSPGARTRTRT